ncbi:MAG: class A beta-lactamase [Hyphomicrobiales bacterium]|nr:class A beta-lactamase [Hyphomicrobiales bacterium]
MSLANKWTNLTLMPLSLAVLMFCLSFSANATSRTLGLQGELEALAKRVRPAIFAIEVLDTKSGESWGVNDDRPQPMMSVFKVPVAAAVLARIDNGEISLDQSVSITRKDLRGASRIARTFRGDNMSFTVWQLLEGMVSYSDNTAADRLVALLGGPQAVTRFLRSKGVEDMRVDLDEGGVAHIFSGLGSAHEPPKRETEKARQARLMKGVRDFLDDPRNRSTPKAAAELLRKLWEGKLLSPASTKRLLALMYGQTKPVRLRAGLPEGVRLADKTGSSVTRGGVTAAFNDIGILTWPNGRTVIIAAFLSGSHASREERTKLFADLARTVASRFP